jgi:NAD(P)-dependent dehydrogenase (short-subunit alcohol dehydrogenase family)
MVFREDALAGKVVLVTGGGTGMGIDMAVGCAEVGADVAVLSRNRDHLDPVAEQIRTLGRRSESVVCDVRDPEQVQAAIEGVVERFGQIDVLVNSAAGNFRCPALDLSPNGWRVVIDIDLNGTFFCSQAAARHMVEQGGGSIVNIIGDFVETHGDRMSHAAAAKSGIWNLTRSLAYEWGKHNIRVNSIAPGPIVTEGGIQALGRAEAFDEIIRSVPIGHNGESRDVTNALIFLASDAAKFVTGANLNVDGGHSFGGYDLP